MFFFGLGASKLNNGFFCGDFFKKQITEKVGFLDWVFTLKVMKNIHSCCQILSCCWPKYQIIKQDNKINNFFFLDLI
jgi:hypothetical protein